LGGWRIGRYEEKFMIASQTGAAPETPLTFLIGSPEKLPNQTPTVYLSE